MQQTQETINIQFQNEWASINPFAQARMGLKAGLTLIKLDTFNIVCVPYRLSMRGAILIASFSREELALFQRYVNGLAGLTLVFQPANSPTPLKIFARCVLKSVSAMKGRESIGLLDVEFKPCPPDLLTILGDYFMLLERLRVEYEDFKGKIIPINAETARSMGFNNYTTVSIGTNQIKVALFGLASDTLDFLVPMNGPALEHGTAIQAKLFFQSFQFAVLGSIQTNIRLQNGVQKVRATIQFSSELVSIIESYRFAERFAPKAAEPAAPSTGQSR